MHYFIFFVPFQVVSCQLTLYLKFHSSSHHQKNPLQTFFLFSPEENTHKKKIKCPIQLLVLQLRILMCQFLTGITVVEWVKCHILPCRYANGKPGRILHCSLIYQLQTIRGRVWSQCIYLYIYIHCAVTEESTSKQRLFILCGCLYVKICINISKVRLQKSTETHHCCWHHSMWGLLLEYQRSCTHSYPDVCDCYPELLFSDLFEPYAS